MTEQKAENPIDDLFRQTFESLPDTPAASGWDTPSDRVWKHVQANMQTPRKGWGIQSILLMSAFAIVLSAGVYWMLQPTASVQHPDTPGAAPLEQHQPGDSDITPQTPEKQPPAADIAPKTPVNGNKTKPTATQHSNDAHPAKPETNTAQPLPGSKPTLPPNTTEAQKKKDEKE